MLGRRATDPVRVILEGDSSILPGSDYEKYKESFFDESHLVLSPSDKPTRFIIRQLIDEHKDAVSAQPSLRQQAKYGIRCALVGVDGYMICCADKTTKPVPAIEYDKDIVSEKWLKELNMPSEHIAKLYMLIDYISEAQLPLSKRSGTRPGRTMPESAETET